MTATDNGAGSPGDPDRIARFRSDIDDLRIAGSGAGEQRLLLLGAVLMVIGVVLGIFGAVMVGTSGGSAADQRAYMAQGSLLGLTLAVVGAALFVRYSTARFLRFWLIRSTYEGRANADRVVASIRWAAGDPEAPAPAGQAPAPAGQAPAPPVQSPAPPVQSPAPPVQSPAPPVFPPPDDLR